MHDLAPLKPLLVLVKLVKLILFKKLFIQGLLGYRLKSPMIKWYFKSTDKRLRLISSF